MVEREEKIEEVRVEYDCGDDEEQQLGAGGGGWRGRGAVAAQSLIMTKKCTYKIKVFVPKGGLSVLMIMVQGKDKASSTKTKSCRFRSCSPL